MATAGTNWRLANSLIKLREQINAAHPNRNKASDGTIGDTAHAATVSDHNPNSADVVTAFDITHDPSNGLDVQKLADAVAASRDARIKYMIFNDRIMIPNDYGWVWRFHYAGSHRSHLHISVWNDYDNTTNWNIGKDKRLMNEQDARLLSSVSDHEGWRDDIGWQHWVGRPFKEYADSVLRADTVWSQQNHVLKVAYPQTVRDLEQANARINELQIQLQKTITPAPEIVLAPSAGTPPETSNPSEPIDGQKVNWLVRILINLFDKKK